MTRHYEPPPTVSGAGTIGPVDDPTEPGQPRPPYRSDPEDLTLHGPRVLGFATASRIARRYALDAEEVGELLLDHEARGLVQHASFAGSSGWSVTDRGRVEDERRMAEELDRAGAREPVAAAHAEFVGLNRRFTQACTDWQLRPTPADRMATNDHTDWPWDERVLGTLASLGRALTVIDGELAGRLARFDGYADRYATALARVDRGERRWVDSPEVDSCHTVWVQLHEDLLSTLGLPRGTDT